MARDPMSPAFHVNLCYGLRFVQLSVWSVRPTRLGRPAPCPGVSISHRQGSNRKRMPQAVREAYKKEKKQRALRLAGLAAIVSIRQSLAERAETAQRQLIVRFDASYTNHVLLRMCRRAPPSSGAFARMPSCTCPCPSAPPLADARASMARRRPPRSNPYPLPRRRPVARKCRQSLWFRILAQSRVAVPLWLVVIQPLGYRLRVGYKQLYHQPAFLVCTDVNLGLQSYIQRWEIECKHHEEGTTAQLFNPPQFQDHLYWKRNLISGSLFD
jgi:hypothetical protein